MKLSTKGRYGVRLMIDLAIHAKNGTVYLKDVAARQGVSEKYLGNLVAVLKGADLITTVRGPHGGYALAKPAGQITLKDIVCTLEDGVCLVDCVSDPARCARSATCAPRDVWKWISDKILEMLSSITLEDMAARQNEKAGGMAYAI